MFSISSGSGDGGSALQGLLGNWEWPQVLGAAFFPLTVVTVSVSALPRHLLGFLTASSTSLAGVRRCSETPFTAQMGGKSANEPCRHHHSVAPWCVGDTNHSESWHPQGPWDAQHRSPLLFDPKPSISVMSDFILWGLQGHRGRTGERGGRKQVFSGTFAAASVIPLFFHFHNLTFPEVTHASWCGLNERKTPWWARKRNDQEQTETSYYITV